MFPQVLPRGLLPTRRRTLEEAADAGCAYCDRPKAIMELLEAGQPCYRSTPCSGCDMRTEYIITGG